MSVEHLAADLVIEDKFGKTMGVATRGDTVTFMYEGEKRTVLVLENTNRHLKGVAKERNAEYRNYLWTKISGMKYAKPFIKKNVSYEVIPVKKSSVVVEKLGSACTTIAVTNSVGNRLVLFAYSNGNLGMNCYSQGQINTIEVTPEQLSETLAGFVAE